METKEKEVYLVSYDTYSITIAVDNTRYVYSAISLPISRLKKEFDKRVKYAPFKALNFVKDNARLVDKYTV